MKDSITYPHWGGRDYFGYLLNHPASWCLRTMITPEGLAYNYEYEADVYQLSLIAEDTISYTWNTAGSRVKTIGVNTDLCDSEDSRDYDSTLSISITYGENDQDCAFISSMPMNYYKALMRYSRPFTYIDHDPYPSVFERAQPDDFTHKLVYPCISWNIPGQGSITEYYTTEYSDKMYFMSYQNVIDVGFLGDFISTTITYYYDIFHSRAYLNGLLNKRPYKNTNGDTVYLETHTLSDPIPIAACIFKADIPGAIFPSISSQGFHRSFGDSGSAIGDTIAACYAFPVKEVETIQDGVRNMTRYTYDPLYRIKTETRISNDHETITTFEYATDWQLDTTIYRCIAGWGTCPGANCECTTWTEVSPPIQEFDSVIISKSPLNSMSEHHYYTSIRSEIQHIHDYKTSDTVPVIYVHNYYRSDFPSQNYPVSQRFWYPATTSEWNDLDYNHIIDTGGTPEELAITEILDRNPDGNPVLIQQPNRRIDGFAYDDRLLAGRFNNIDTGSTYLLYTCEGDCDDVLGPTGHIDSTEFFTGNKSIRINQHASQMSPGFNKSFESLGIYIGLVYGQSAMMIVIWYYYYKTKPRLSQASSAPTPRQMNGNF